MSTGTLTEAVQPYELGARAAWLQGRIPLSSFVRLGALIEGGQTAADASLRFSLDEQRRCMVDGAVEVGLQLRCLGCLESVAHALRVDIHLVLVHSDAEAAALMGVADAMVVGDEAIELPVLLEDDLILALPEVVCGGLTGCPRRPSLEYGDAAHGTSPFGALAGQLARLIKKPS